MASSCLGSHCQKKPKWKEPHSPNNGVYIQLTNHLIGPVRVPTLVCGGGGVVGVGGNGKLTDQPVLRACLSQVVHYQKTGLGNSQSY